MNEPVGRNLRFWTHASVIALCCGAWGSAGLFYFESNWSTAVLCIGVAVTLFTSWRSYAAVKEDPNLSEESRVAIVGWFKSVGPVAVVQLLLFIHSPGSKFAGH